MQIHFDLRYALKRHERWLIPACFFIIAALIYLPLVAQFGFYKDDWYLMYAARVQGPGFFSTIFASDRPARAPLQFVLYNLFGEHLLYYHISAYIFRVIGALALRTSLDLLWVTQKRTSLLASLLFLIYPGFLSQPNAVDFQAHIFSLMLAMISIALSIKAILTTQIKTRWLLAILSILSAWFYLGLMEYFIGLEVLRFALIALVAWRQASGSGQTEQFRRVVLLNFFRKMSTQYAIFALGPVGFLAWRLFIFESDRRATDIGAQVGQLFSSPLNTGLWWLIYLLQDGINVVITAWVLPLYTLAFPLRLREMIPALVIGILTAIMVWAFWKYLQEEDKNRNYEILIIGFLGVLGGLFPVILANRHINFSDYSRYTLPAIAGGVLILVWLMLQIKPGVLRGAVVLFLAANAGMTHYANASLSVKEAYATRDFWWQVAWRIPALKSGTSLAVDYPSISIQEDYFVWGPANQIYFPEKQSGLQVDVPLTAIVLNTQNTLLINVGRGQDTQIRRGNLTLTEYNDVLVMSQPSGSACVRVIDGKLPELSENDRPEIMLIASNSRTDGILLDRLQQTPPAAFFGSEPAHKWCFYYQKASLARQQGDWQKVVSLGEKAIGEGFYPSDKIEWMPFLQAYVALGQKNKLRRFVSIMRESPFIQEQACAALTISSPDPTMSSYVKESFCR